MSSQFTPVKYLFAKLSPQVLQELMGSFEKLHFDKGQHLLHINQVCKHMYLLQSGAIRHYRITKKGEEMNTWFSFENDVVSHMPSFVKQKPSNTGLIAVEPCEVLAIQSVQVEKLRMKYHEFETFSRKLIEDYMIFTEMRSYSMQENDALGRYHELIKLNPKVEERIPKTHIASYLGIKKETLSRLKKKVINL